MLPPVCIWLLFCFLFLHNIPYLSVNSVPGLLFILLCLTDRASVRDMLFAYRREVLLVGSALLVGLLFSQLPGKSAKGVYDFLRGAILFFPVLYLVRHHQARLVAILPWATFVSIVYLWVAVCFSAQGSLFDWSMVPPSFSKLLGHYNTYGTAAAVVCIAALTGLLSQTGSRPLSLALAAAAIAGFLLTFYSGSRGSLVALLAAGLVLAFLKFPKWRWWLLAAGVLCFLALAGLMLYSSQHGALMSSWQRNSDDVTSGRFSIYTATLGAILQQAPLTGFGPNTFKYLELSHTLENQHLGMPHSVYLESLYSLGGIGSALLAAALGSLLLRMRGHRTLRPLSYFGAGLAVLYLLRGLLDYKLFGVPYPGAMAAALGFMLGSQETTLPHAQPGAVATGGSSKAVFLDRDGTINVDKHYLHKSEDLEFIPGAEAAIKRLKDAGFLVIVVSNQSGIGRGYFDEHAVETLHGHIQAKLAEYGTAIDAFYFCPHHPEKGIGDYKIACACRKGEPGMLLQAALEHGIDLQSSFMVGDKLADIEAGQRAGCQPILVLTGYGESIASNEEVAAVEKCPDLDSAASFILRQHPVPEPDA